MKKLTFAMENYLEAIYELSGGNSGSGSQIYPRKWASQSQRQMPCRFWPVRDLLSTNKKSF